MERKVSLVVSLFGKHISHIPPIVCLRGILLDQVCTCTLVYDDKHLLARCLREEICLFRFLASKHFFDDYEIGNDVLKIFIYWCIE